MISECLQERVGYRDSIGVQADLYEMWIVCKECV